MSDPAAWAGVALALLSFAFTEWRVRQERRRCRALGPGEEVRAAIVDMRRCFTEISASGGTDKKYFLPRRISTLESTCETALAVSRIKG